MDWSSSFYSQFRLFIIYYLQDTCSFISKDDARQAFEIGRAESTNRFKINARQKNRVNFENYSSNIGTLYTTRARCSLL